MNKKLIASLAACMVVVMSWLVMVDDTRNETLIEDGSASPKAGAEDLAPVPTAVKPVFSGKIADPRSRPRTAADLRREYEEKHPLKASGARYHESDDKPKTKTAVPEEFAQWVRPDPNQPKIDEIYHLRGELNGAVRETASQRADDFFDSILATGDSELVKQAIKNLGSSKLNAQEELVREALSAFNVEDPYYAGIVAQYMAQRRADAQSQLENGNPGNPQHLADHIEWLDQAAEKMRFDITAETGGALMSDWQEFTDTLWPPLAEELAAREFEQQKRINMK